MSGNKFIILLVFLSSVVFSSRVFKGSPIGDLFILIGITSFYLGILYNGFIRFSFNNRLLNIYLIFLVYNVIVICIHGEIPMREIAYILVIFAIFQFRHYQYYFVKLCSKYVILNTFFILISITLMIDFISGFHIFSLKRGYQLLPGIPSSGGIMHNAAPYALLCLYILVLTKRKLARTSAGIFGLVISNSRATYITALLFSLTRLNAFKILFSLVIGTLLGVMWALSNSSVDILTILRLDGKDISSGRFDIWFVYWNIVTDNLLFGLGSEYIHVVGVIYELEGYKEGLSDKAHNLYLTILVKYGLFSLILLLIFLLTTVRELFKNNINKEYGLLILVTFIFAFFNETMMGGMRLPTLMLTFLLVNCYDHIR